MIPSAISKRPIIFSTLILSAAGIVTRILGFYYRIFLSHTIGAEGLGIYQLIFPVLMLGMAVGCFGIQTAISKFTAQCVACEPPVKRPCPQILSAGLLISCVLSVLFALILYYFSTPIAVYVIDEPRCASLLRILSFSVPLSSIHSCINGYYYGIKKAAIPSISQILEQLARVCSVYIIYRVAIAEGNEITPAGAVWGLVIGEVIAVLFTMQAFGLQHFHLPAKVHMKNIFLFSIPLSANRILLTVFQSAEAILIPIRLRDYGLQTSEALSTLGILTGMAVPVIMFPCVLTNSLSVMLLPSISEAQATQNSVRIHSLIQKTILLCSCLGLICTFGFLLTGNWIGAALFGNVAAGKYITTLGWLCPFLFLGTTLNSILNGMGKTGTTLFLNLTGSLMRLVFIFIGMPLFGIRAYLISMLVSQLYICVGSLCYLARMRTIKG